MPKMRDGGNNEGSQPPPPPPNTGQPDVQVPDSPQQWYYNDDITDPVNFGFMFPVPKGGRKEGSSVTSNLTNSSIVGPSVADTSSASFTRADKGKGKQRISPSSVPRQIPEAAKFLARPSDYQENSQQEAPVTQPSLASLAASERQSISRHLPLRYNSSLHVAQDSVLPPQQYFSVTSTLINQRSPRYGPPTSQEAESSFFPTGVDPFYNDNDFSIQNFINSLPYGDPIVTQEPVVSASLAGPSAKRRAQRSPSPIFNSYPTHSTKFPSRSPPNFFHKRRRGVDGLSPQQNYHYTDPNLCVRCMIYNKAYTGSGLCEKCIQATNFTAWPSLRGTRRENMETLVLYLLPVHMEDCIRQMPANIPQARTWRLLPTPPPEQEHDFSALVFQDKCALVKEQVRSTGLFSEDFADLADIAQKYQRSLPTPNPTLEACCTLLAANCELYKSFVAVGRSKSAVKNIDVPALIEKIQSSRILMFRGFRELQEMALSSSDTRNRETWLPSFLCAVWMTISAVLFLDMLVACPSPWKEQIWGQGWHQRITEMRHGGYGMLVHILQANTKGINPLKLNVWSDDISAPPYTPSALTFQQPGKASPLAVSTGYTQNIAAYDNQHWSQPSALQNPGMESHIMAEKLKRDRQILLGREPAALQGLLALKAWQARYDDHLKMGEDMFSKDLYSLALMKPIAGLWRVFEMK